MHTMTKRQGKSGTIDVKAVLAEDEEFLRALVRTALQEVLEAEMTEALGAEKGERAADRQGYRSGYYGRTLITRVGKLELRVPQDRSGRFSTELFERYQRSERALVAALAEMYVQGVSTRKVKAITEELCGHSFSASSISAMNQRLDASLAQFAGRPLVEAFPYLILDARYERVREAGVIASPAVLIAIGIDWDGRRQVLAVELAKPREPIELAGFPAGAEGARSAGRRVCRRRRSCRAEGGAARGSGGGGLSALLRAFPAQRARLRAAPGRRRLPAGAAMAIRSARPCRGAPRSRCLARQVVGQVPQADRLGRREHRRNADPRLRRGRLFYRPRQHHKHLKSTNMLERLNEEIRRRTYVVRIFPNGESCLRLVRALAVETHENWLEQHRYLNMDDLREHKKEALRRAA